MDEIWRFSKLRKVNLWYSRIQENNYTPTYTIFHLICDNVRLRISGLQKVADTPANGAMCERWSFLLNILAPGRFTA